MTVKRVATAVALLALVAGGVTGCSEEPVESFTSDTRSGFLAACAVPLEDSRLTRSICECVFDETQIQLSFDEFQAIDRRLVEDPEAGLPEELNSIVAECVIGEADL